MSIIVESTAVQNDRTKDWYVREISSVSNKYGDKLIHMMDIYNVDSLRELRLEDAKEYYEKYILGGK